jgi:hypothetical protein
MAKQAVKSKLVAQKGSYKLWTTSDNKLGLKAAVNAVFAGKNPTTATQQNLLSVSFPIKLLIAPCKSRQAAVNTLIDDINDSLFDWHAITKIKQNMLKNPEYQKVQSIICSWNNLHNGITTANVAEWLD